MYVCVCLCFGVFNFLLSPHLSKILMFLFYISLSFSADEGKKLHFVSPARRKSVLAPILNKIKNGNDANGNGTGSGGGGSSISGGSGIGGNGSDTEKKSNATDSTGHISVQIEPAKKVKVSFDYSSARSLILGRMWMYVCVSMREYCEATATITACLAD